MPRSSSSSRSTARSSTTHAPPVTNSNTQQNQIQAPASKGSGIMGALMTGMAFGAASELMRG